MVIPTVLSIYTNQGFPLVILNANDSYLRLLDENDSYAPFSGY